MSQTAVNFICAAIGALTTLFVWLVDRFDLASGLVRRPRLDVSGTWHGWSIYVPVDGFFSRDREAIYETVAEFKQRGRRITFTERLVRIYDIDGNHLTALEPRRFTGRGTIGGGFDISARFTEDEGLTVGSMHLVVDSRADELNGILAVRPQIPGRPVAVRILLRRGGQPAPTWEELGVRRLQTLAHDEPRLPDEQDDGHS